MIRSWSRTGRGQTGSSLIQAFVSANDDHTLLFAASGSFTVHPHQYAKLPYKPEDLVPISQVSNTIIATAVPELLGVTTLKELVDLARSKPGQLNVALVPGITEFVFFGFANTEGLTFTKIPYRDIVQAGTDVGEGRVQVMMASYAIIRPHLQRGKARLVIVNGAKRIPHAPEMPTAAEAGFPSMELDGLVGLFGPRSMPKETREKIAADIRAVAAEDPTIAERLSSTAQIINVAGPDEFAASIEGQRAKVAEIAQRLGIKPTQSIPA